MGPSRPRSGSHNVVTRPLAPSQPTPSQPQHEAPDHAARRRTPPPLRLSVKPRSARRSSGWHDVALAAGKRNAKKSSISQHFAMDSAQPETVFGMQASVVGKNFLGGASYLIVRVYVFVSMHCKWSSTSPWPQFKLGFCCCVSTEIRE